MENDTLIGIDLSKRMMQVCVMNGLGEVLKEMRVRRDRLVEVVARYPGAAVAMEACAGAHYWGRVFERLGHAVRMIAPEVAKAYRNPAFKDDLVAEPEVPGIERVRGMEVDYLLVAKVRPGRQFDIGRELRRRIKACFEANKIKAGAPNPVFTSAPSGQA